MLIEEEHQSALLSFRIWVFRLNGNKMIDLKNLYFIDYNLVIIDIKSLKILSS